MRPLDQQTILVTGATDGHGRGLARELARRGATVLIHGRNQGRIDATVADIAEETGGNRPAGYLADLGSLAAVRRLADDVSTRGGLDALVNNAGIAPRVRTVSADGYELTFAVNYLAPFLLTYLLLPALRKRAHARIVNVASGAQAPVNFGDVMLEHGYSWEFAYAQSKFALIAFTFELARRLQAGSETRVTANALHPATLMPTKLVFESYGRTLDSLEKGVGATLWLVTDRKLDRVSGTFFNGRTEARADRGTYDGDTRRRLWDLSERLCGLR